MQSRTVLYICIGVLILALFFCARDHDHKEPFLQYTEPLAEQEEGTLSAPSDGIPLHGTDLTDWNDISQSPGFGIGPGTVGFGRYGQDFMA
jgi:hypothetical protein